MLDPKVIENWIAEGMSCVAVDVEGDGHHFEAVVVSAEFEGMNRVQRQQRVFKTVKEHLDAGTLHALAMKTLTPAEWAEKGI